MRRISSAPCIQGMATPSVSAPLLAPRQSGASSTSGSVVQCNALPIDMLIVQNATPLSTIGQCIIDKIVTDGQDEHELALCLATPSHAPELTFHEPMCPKLQERHTAFIEVRMRARRSRGNGNGGNNNDDNNNNDSGEQLG